MRFFYHWLFRLQIRVRCWLADRLGSRESTVPPAMLRFRVTESLSVKEFVRIGEGVAQHIRQRLFDGHLEGRRVLDFGCGCGRTLRWMLGEGSRESGVGSRETDGGMEFHGVDVDREAIEWCKGHLNGAQFMANAPEPPL